jgi:DNA sulfur modification protein DndC
VTFVAWAIQAGKIDPPESLTVLYADTRQEIPPLQQAAMNLLADLRRDGFETKIVLPPMDKRYFVYMLGRGVPPPNNGTLRWCTRQIKVDPMMASLEALREQIGQKLLMITGVRLGESEARDQRIALSCSTTKGECGQGWFQEATKEAVADTLAPLVHWRVCHVWDWLFFGEHNYSNVSQIADVYGDDDVRTGCAGCPLVDRDVALERLVKTDEWAHLKPLLELKPLYRELRYTRQWRLRKPGGETRKDGTPVKNQQRLGPLTMKARKYGLERVLDIQKRSGVDLINADEEARIRELWTLNIWPQRWTGNEPTGDKPVERVDVTDAGQLVTQELLV